MAATETLLTWSGLPALTCNATEESSMATMLARLQAMTMAAQAKDAAFSDLQRRLNAALAEAELGWAREAALLRRAEKAEEAEEALASQMAELEAEAFTRITQVNKLLQAASRVEPVTTSQLSIQVQELERRLQVAVEDAAALAGRCEVLEEELEQARVRESAFQRRAEIAEEAEEALASQMAELEAEAFTRITENSKLVAQERISLCDERCPEEEESIERSQAAELRRQLAEAEEELGAVNAKLCQAEEKNQSLEMRLACEGERVLSLSLQDVAGFVKLKLWNPSSLTLPVGNTNCC